MSRRGRGRGRKKREKHIQMRGKKGLSTSNAEKRNHISFIRFTKRVMCAKVTMNDVRGKIYDAISLLMSVKMTIMRKNDVIHVRLSGCISVAKDKCHEK